MKKKNVRMVDSVLGHFDHEATLPLQKGLLSEGHEGTMEQRLLPHDIKNLLSAIP